MQKKQSQKEKIYNLLSQAGNVGVSNYDLNNICFRYGARIQELRQEGYNIESKKVVGSMWKFILKEV